MRKRNTLYTANKWNRPLFMPEENLFWGIQPGSNQMQIGRGGYSLIGTQQPQMANAGYGNNMIYSSPALNAIQSSQTQPITNSFQHTGAELTRATSSGKGSGGGAGAGWTQAGKVAADIGMEMADSVGQSEKFKRGLWDRMDPVHYLAGGNESTVGNALGDAGVGLFKAGAKSGNWQLMVAGAAAKVLGGGYNALFGEGVDEKKDAANKEATNYYSNYRTNAGTFDDIQGLTSQVNYQDAHTGGLFKKDAARKKNEEDRRRYIEANLFAQNSLNNNINNISADQLNDALSNYAALGGPIDTTGMGAIEYGFMSDYLDTKKKQTEQKEKLTNMFMGTPSGLFADGGGIHIKHPGRLTALKERTGKTEAELWAEGRPEVRKMITFARNARKWNHADGGPLNLFYQQDTPLFAFGGDMQTNGADFGTGLTHIDAGGSHEMNPNDGVQMGVDPEGTPNLVEEGEVVFNDYVYSQRINMSPEAKAKFRLPKKKDITYADAAKKLEKEIAERPNDPISQAGFSAQMQALAEEQERQKAEMEAERAKAAFEALSPEEQTAIMQRAAQEEAMAQQASQQEALAAQQQALNEEQVALNQQQEAAMSQPEVIGGQSMMAEGGHLFKGGGKVYENIFKALGFNTMGEFKKWAKDNKVVYDDPTYWDSIDEPEGLGWDAIMQDPNFRKAISKDNPALAHALSKNYDFGAFTPDNTGNVTFKDISKGNWTAQDYEGWKDSQDPAWLEAVEKGLVKEGMKQEDIAKALKQTDSYKRGSKWLQDSEDNRLRYLRTILEDKNSPDVAKNYAKKFIDANGWKQGAARDYATIFGADGKGVRETHPGTYWHTPIEAVRGAQAQNWVINEDGSVEPIIGDIPKDWTAAGNYAWATPENDLTYNYYKRPEVQKTPEQKVAEEKEAKALERRVMPVYDNSLFGVEDLGPLVAMGMMGAGIGKPDFSGMNNIMANAARNYHLATNKYLGNYLKYQPMDIWFEQAKLDAMTNANHRAIANSTSNPGTKIAGHLAADLNAQLASGELYRKGLEYNDANEERKATFNRGTDQFNAEAFNNLSRFNAGVLNDANRAYAQLGMQAERDKLDANAGWYNSLYGNLNAINQNLGARRKENRQRNMIADMAASGIYGVINPDRFNPNGMLRWETDEEYQKRLAKQAKQAACGGKLKKGKKRGLTF